MATGNKLVYQSGSLTLQTPDKSVGADGLFMELYGNLSVQGDVFVQGDTLQIDEIVSFSVADAYVVLNFGERGPGVASEETKDRSGLLVDRALYSLVESQTTPGLYVVEREGGDPDGSPIYRDDPAATGVINDQGVISPPGPYPATAPASFVWEEPLKAWDLNTILVEREDQSGSLLPALQMAVNPRIVNLGTPLSDSDETAATNVEYVLEKTTNIINDVLNRLSNEYLNAGIFATNINGGNLEITRSLTADLLAIDETDNIPIMYWENTGAPDNPSTDENGSWGGKWKYKPFEIFDDKHPTLAANLDVNDFVISNTGILDIVFESATGEYQFNGTSPLLKSDAGDITLAPASGTTIIGTVDNFRLETSSDNAIITTGSPTTKLKIHDMVYPSGIGLGANEVLVTNPTGNEFEIKSISSAISESVTLDDLNDVGISNPLNKDVLYYNGTSWINRPFELAIDSTPQLSGNLDVRDYLIINSVANGDIGTSLSGSGSFVVDLDDSGTGALVVSKSGAGIISSGINEDIEVISGSSVIKFKSGQNIGELTLGLSNISSTVSTSPNVDLIFNSNGGNLQLNQMIYPSNVAPGENYVLLTTATGDELELKELSTAIGGLSTLDSLADVTITSPSLTQFLAYNGFEWINTPYSIGSPSAHGLQTQENLHAVVTTTTDGFMSAEDKVTLDDLVSSGAQPNQTIIAGAGLSGGGSGSTVTINAVGGDGITVNSTDIGVDNTVVRTVGDQTINGLKTFGSTVRSPTFVENGISIDAKYAPMTHSHDIATGTDPGFMSASDKAKLDGITAGGGDANQNAFSRILVPGHSDVVADSVTDSFTISTIGGGLIIATDASTDTVTIAHNDTSSQDSVNNTGGTVIQDVTLDGFGHVSGIGSINLDGRYVNGTNQLAQNRLNINNTHFITENDGGGNFNIRIGHEFDGGNISTEIGTAFHQTWDNESESGTHRFFVSTTNATSEGQLVTFREMMSYDRDSVILKHQGVTKVSTSASGATINGAVVASSFNTSSALRYKEDIDYNIKDALDKVLAIDVIAYVSKTDSTKKKRLGVSAESVAKVAPEFVAFNEEGLPDSVNYGQMTALLIQAIKEQEENKLINKMKAFFSKVYRLFTRK